MLVSSAAEYFTTLDKRFAPAAAKGFKGIFQFVLTGDGGGTWHVVVDDSTMTVGDGPSPTPAQATMNMDAGEWVKMANGQLNGMMAVMKGILKVQGNVMLAKKMQDIFPISKG